MDDNVNGVAQTVDNEDLNTTAPNPPLKWQMPEPVFRRTSGRLPQGFKKELEKAKAERAGSDPEVVNEIVRENPTNTNEPDAEPEPKSSTLKLVLVLLGLAAMIGFIAVFLTVVYFFFLS
ncbi:MAG: hypothetical protein ABI646_08660 [Acidobacteriota bacterium]